MYVGQEQVRSFGSELFQRFTTVKHHHCAVFLGCKTGILYNSIKVKLSFYTVFMISRSSQSILNFFSKCNWVSSPVDTFSFCVFPMKSTNGIRDHFRSLMLLDQWVNKVRILRVFYYSINFCFLHLFLFYMLSHEFNLFLHCRCLIITYSILWLFASVAFFFFLPQLSDGAAFKCAIFFFLFLEEGDPFFHGVGILSNLICT